MFLSALLTVACARLNFSTGPVITCQGSGVACISANRVDGFDYVVQAERQPVDILFVIDNSDSMYSIQQQIGLKFPTLLNYVGDYDYHIGIVTTDISGSANPPGPINRDGRYQDGNLLPFANGEKFLTRDSIDTQGLFEKNISRQETRQCQNWVAASCDSVRGCGDTAAYRSSCPSEDTRAIFAAYLTIAKDHGEFFRAAAPFASLLSQMLTSGPREGFIRSGRWNPRTNRKHLSSWSDSGFKEIRASRSIPSLLIPAIVNVIINNI
jgi:hypothetical protein